MAADTLTQHRNAQKPRRVILTAIPEATQTLVAKLAEGALQQQYKL